MSWIEGIGDEVPIVFILATLVIVVFMLLAWKSTDVPEPALPSPVEPLSSTPHLQDPPTNAEPHAPGPPGVPEGTASTPQDPRNPGTSSEHSDQPAVDKQEPAVGQCPEAVEESGTSLRRRQNVTEETTGTSRTENTILIRLKYIDDRQMLVESPITTTLGDFKR